MVLNGVSIILSFTAYTSRKFFDKLFSSHIFVKNFPFPFSVKIDPDEGFLKTGKYPTLTVLSAGHALHVFVNDQLSGEHCRDGRQVFFGIQLN